jgi:hypothetical protein
MESAVEPLHTAAQRLWPGRSRWWGGAWRRGRVSGGGWEGCHKWWRRVSGLTGTGPIQGRAGAGLTRWGPAVSDGGHSAGTGGGVGNRGGGSTEFEVECTVWHAGREK